MAATLPQNPSNQYSLRFLQKGNLTNSFADNLYNFVHPVNVILGTPVQAYSQYMRITAGASDLEVSFDGVAVQAFVPANTVRDYPRRHEGGIAVRFAALGGIPATFIIEAW